MTTPAPASPLPWYVTGPLSEEEACRIGGVPVSICRSVPDEDGGADRDIDLFDDGLSEADAAYIVHAANTLPKVEAERDRLRALLKTLEYVDPQNEFGTDYCPCCGSFKGDSIAGKPCPPHRDTCALAAALKETP